MIENSFKVIKENLSKMRKVYQPRILCPTKISFKNENEFHLYLRFRKLGRESFVLKKYFVGDKNKYSH